MTNYSVVYSGLDQVREFHDKFGCAVDAPDTWSLRTARLKLIEEEFKEVVDALLGEDLEHVAKELADLRYVVEGTAVSLGIDLDEAFRRVHESNMSKVWADGKVHYNDEGKVLKPPTYQPPDMTGVAP